MIKNSFGFVHIFWLSLQWFFSCWNGCFFKYETFLKNLKSFFEVRLWTIIVVVRVKYSKGEVEIEFPKVLGLTYRKPLSESSISWQITDTRKSSALKKWICLSSLPLTTEVQGNERLAKHTQCLFGATSDNILVRKALTFKTSSVEEV